MKSILIVEDDDVLLRVLKNRFSAAGWQVLAADNGEEAMKIAGREQLDLVLLDLILPKKNGFEVLAEIRKENKTKMLPVLVTSNLGTESDVKKALALGANDYFIKTQHQITEILEKADQLTGKK